MRTADVLPITAHDAVLKRAGLPTLKTLTRRILAVYDRATSDDLEAGASWYIKAHVTAINLGNLSGVGLEAAAAVISHLSPRTSWARNLDGATALLTQKQRRAGILGRNYDKAVECLDHPTPSDSFTGKKTERFFLNMMGNWEVVTIDIWAARVAGVEERHLKRVGIYEALEAAYQRAARMRNVEPAVMQATTWVVVRNGRAA